MLKKSRFDKLQGKVATGIAIALIGIFGVPMLAQADLRDEEILRSGGAHACRNGAIGERGIYTGHTSVQLPGNCYLEATLEIYACNGQGGANLVRSQQVRVFQNCPDQDNG